VARTDRYELWVPHESAKKARDCVYLAIYEGESEPTRGPDIPATPDTPAYATFHVTMRSWGLRRSGLHKNDEVLSRIARDLRGHAVTSEWGPKQQVGVP
jgi:hypothetical protein